MDERYGRHGYFTAQPGHGEELAEILLAAAQGLKANEGCLLYVVSRSEEPDTVWVTEAWTSKAAHDDSLRDTEVKAVIQKALPLIAGMEGKELRPIGGKGI